MVVPFAAQDTNHDNRDDNDEHGGNDRHYEVQVGEDYLDGVAGGHGHRGNST